jgi:hypothetical protein
MGYILVAETTIMIAFVAVVFLSATAYYFVELAKQRIRELSRAAQHAELNTAIPYYTGSGVPINHELEDSSFVYRHLNRKLEGTIMHR